MKVSLNKEQNDFVNKKIEDGSYASAEEVVLKGLDDFKKREEYDEYIRVEVQKGIDQIRAGNYISIKTEAEHDAFFEDIIRRGKERLEAGKK